jgi:hypothetical protein
VAYVDFVDAETIKPEAIRRAPTSPQVFDLSGDS